jgi:YVTN family beta-propeller protein
VPASGHIADHPTSPTEDGGCGLAAAGTSAWAATNGPDGVMRIDYDPVAGRSRVAWGETLPAARALAFSRGWLWGIDSAERAVLRIDPKTGRLESSVGVGSDPAAIAAGAGAVWVANTGDNSVSRIDRDTNVVRQVIGVGNGPAAIATGAGAVWVALADDGAVARIDPGGYQPRHGDHQGGPPPTGRRGRRRDGLGHRARVSTPGAA